MPIRIVDGLEAIHVDHDQGQWSLVPARTLKLISQGFVEFVPIEQAGESIGDRPGAVLP